jgi:hypothetical protein
MRPRQTILPSILGTILVAGSAVAHEGESVLLVAGTADGRLVVSVDLAEPTELAASIFPGIHGFATGELAFHSTLLDEPEENLFQLSPAADFRFVLMAKDPGMEVWNDSGSGYLEVGDSFYLGPSPFDTHPIWNLVTATLGQTYSLTLKVRDLKGIYPETAPLLLSFTPQVPPCVHLASVSSSQVRLWWPTNSIGWKLSDANSLPAIDWNVVTNVPESEGTNFVVHLPVEDSARYFRLQPGN